MQEKYNARRTFILFIRLLILTLILHSKKPDIWLVKNETAYKDNFQTNARIKIYRA